MNLFLLNGILAVSWCALTGNFGGFNLITGFAFSYFALWMAKPLYDNESYFRRFRLIFLLCARFLYELVVSSFRVFWDVLTPNFRSQPGVVVVPLKAKTDVEITVLSSLISLTPGTLSLDVSRDRTKLFVHAMYVDDVDTLREEIRNGLEKRLLEAFR